MKNMVSAALAVLVLASCSAAESLQLKADSTGLRLYYGETLLAPKIEAYIADPEWRTLLRWSGNRVNTGESKWSRGSKAESGGITLEAQSENGKIYLAATFDIPAESLIRYICFDIFLNRTYFYGPLKTQLGPMPRQLAVRTALGTLVATQLTGKTPWTIRDESAAAWRGKSFRTVTLLAQMQKELSVPFRKTIRLSLEFIPAEESLAAVRAEKLKILEKTLRETGGVSPEFEEAARLLAAKTPDSKVLDRIENVFTAEARGRKAYRNTEFAGIVIPAPRNRELRAGRFVFPAEITVTATDSAAENAAAVLRDELVRYRGIPQGGSPRIVIGTTEDLPEEGYSLTVAPDRISVSGNGTAGTIHGVQTLIQLLKKAPTGEIYADCTVIRDWPERGFRGIMLIPANLSGRADFLKDAVRRFVSRYKYNVLLFGEDAAGNMEWTSHPEITSPHRLPAVKVREIVEYARFHGLKLIPVIQSLGHNKATVKAHPELADDAAADPGALCVSHPGTRRLLADLYDEAIELYRPEYVHIGCDEIFSIGRNPRCGGRAPAELLAEHLNWCSDYLKKRGCKTIVWHDMLLESGKWSSPANSGKSQVTHPALDKLNREIVIGFWSYKEKGEFPAIAYFRRKGFPVLASGWFDPENYVMLERAVRKNGGLGTVATSWMFETFCTTALTSTAGADAAWRANADFTPFPNNLYSAHAHAAMLPPQPSEFAGTRTFPVSLTGAANAIPEKALAMLPEGPVVFSGLNFELASRNGGRCVTVGTGERSPEIALAGPAKGIVFLHTASTFRGYERVGCYEISYTDGSRVQAELFNRRNIFGVRQPVLDTGFSEELYRGFYALSKPVWRGSSPDGDPLTLQAFEWQNPHPEKELKSVAVVCDGRKSIALTLLALSIVK